MNAIEKALLDIKFAIPKEILHWTFGTTPVGSRRRVVSEDFRLRQEVIEARVLPDCNLLGGVQVVVPLQDMPCHYLPDGSVLYQITKERLQGRRLQSVLSVATGDCYRHAVTPSAQRGTFATQLLSKIVSANIPAGFDTSNRVRLVGENAVLIEDYLTVPWLYLRCVVSDDNHLSNFSPRAFPYFSKLCLLATKAHIYRFATLPIDEGVLSGGLPLGRFKEVIDSYSDSETLYTEYLTTTFAKMLFQQDREAHARHLRAITGGSLF